MTDVANACNRYPSISIEYKILNAPEEIISEELVNL